MEKFIGNTQKKLTIAELLNKNYPNPSYGDIKKCSQELECTPKQFTRWAKDKTKPNSDTTILLLQKMGMLKEGAK
jgi:hypothetical protein